ncbi:Retrovirus-related Pol polyprotein, partial [Mucuna pruriens]
MALEYMENTTFITQWGTFYYKAMPFSLKNARATYQQVMVALFHDMMHKELEVYVDDMIAKSRTDHDHIQDLEKLFERLRKYRLHLNPTKCTFGVKSGKLLRFIVSEKGIEVDPDKVKAILEMEPPQTKKEKKECDEDCQKAFEKIKSYLKNLLVLVPAMDGRPLIMYLTVLEESMGCVVRQHNKFGKKEQAIYYLSKKFTECETRYSIVERTCCALAWAARRLRSYMLSHTTWLISKIDPIKYIFEKPTLIGKMAIKGSVLAYYLGHSLLVEYQPMKHDFLDEDILSLTKEEGQEEEWTLLFDGASNALGYEYEACAMGITMALEYQVKNLKVYGDSTLVVHQLRGEWETRDAKLAPYHSYIRELAEHFETITFHHMLREDN